MRRTSKVLVLLGLLCLTCGGLDNILVTAGGQSTIPAGGPLDPLLGQFQLLGELSSFDITQTEEFENQGYSRDQIDSVKLSRFTLTVTSPEDGNFDFLDRIAFFAESEGLPRVEVARLDPVPDGVKELDLMVLDVQLADYAAAESMSITTEAEGRLPAEETSIEAFVELNVDVNVSGAACSVR